MKNPLETAPASRSGPSVSLLGCGWLGIALAPRLQQEGFHVRGSTTRSNRLGLLSSLDIEPLLFRIEPEVGAPEAFPADSTAAKFFESETLVIGLPPETSLGPEYHPGQIATILSRVTQSRRPPAHLVYVSSTSVYGASQGAVDESTRPLPDEGSGPILVRTESALRSYASERGLALTIVRPGGLIGPGRHPGLFLAGRSNVANGDAPVNMISQADLVEILVSVIADVVPAPGEVAIYNAVSDHHPSRREFYTRTAEAIGVAAPVFSSAPSIESPKFVSAAKIRALPRMSSRFDDLYAAIGVRAQGALQ